MYKFDWAVPTRGFVWAQRELYPDFVETKRAKASRFLVPVPSTDAPLVYDVFSYPAMFRAFASISESEDGVLQFANRYGWLGGIHSVKVAEPDPIEEHAFWPGNGELLVNWLGEVRLMRHAVFDLWDNIRCGQARKLSQFVEWQRYRDGERMHMRAFYSAPQFPGWKPSPAIEVADQPEDEEFPRVRKGDLLAPAWRGLIAVINARLKLYPVAAELLDTSDSQNPSASFTLPAPSLIGALWLQFARAVAENRGFKACEECGADFEITTDKRADARFCSSACRLRAHRKRGESGKTRKRKKQ